MQTSDALLWAAAVIGRSFRADLLAEVAGVDRLAALDGLSDSAFAGVVRLDAGGGHFVDVAARDDLYASIPPSTRARLHGRAAQALAGRHDEGRPVDPAVLAHHLLASGADDRKAGQLFIAAGDLAINDHRYAESEEYYQRALEALDSVEETDRLRPMAWIRLGEARLAHGELRVAREAFRAAVPATRRAGCADLLARAALGLGSGPAGFEVGMVDRFQVDLLEESLAELPESELSLRARVLARLAVALTLVATQERRVSLADEAVGLARRAKDPAALSTALSAQCDVFSAPEHAGSRERMAGEIVSIARAIPDPEMELIGRRHHLLALAETGDMEGVDGEIRDYAALSDVLGRPIYAWYVPLWRGMRALMAGRIPECRRWLGEAEAVGRSAGSHLAYLLTGTLRWCLLSETADRAAIAAFARTLNVGEEPGVWADVALALMAAETGRTDDAGARLDSVAPRIVTSPRDSEWVPMLAQLAELIGHLGGHPVAGWVYQALLPFADMLVVEGIGAAIRGSAHRHLGLLAASLGNHEQAAAHFAAAVSVHRALGAPLLVARALRDWWVSLGDEPALAGAIAGYEQLGLDERITELRDASGPVTRPADRQQRFLKEGEMWSLTFAGQTIRLPDAKGLRDLARLMARPGMPVPAVELVVPGGARPGGARAAAIEGLHPAGDLGDVVDPVARAAYRRRLIELDEELTEAEEFSDPERAARARAERDAIAGQLAAAYGLGGRPRRSGDPAERARTAVTARIRDAIRRIEEHHPDLGRHLRLSVRTGRLCVYEPDRPQTWTLN